MVQDQGAWWVGLLSWEASLPGSRVPSAVHEPQLQWVGDPSTSRAPFNIIFKEYLKDLVPNEATLVAKTSACELRVKPSLAHDKKETWAPQASACTHSILSPYNTDYYGIV